MHVYDPPDDLEPDDDGLAAPAPSRWPYCVPRLAARLYDALEEAGVGVDGPASVEAVVGVTARLGMALSETAEAIRLAALEEVVTSTGRGITLVPGARRWS
jgi:hypothetical protein